MHPSLWFPPPPETYLSILPFSIGAAPKLPAHSPGGHLPARHIRVIAAAQAQSVTSPDPRRESVRETARSAAAAKMAEEAEEAPASLGPAGAEGVEELPGAEAGERDTRGGWKQDSPMPEEGWARGLGRGSPGLSGQSRETQGGCRAWIRL